MRSLVITVALLLVLPATAQAAEGDIIVQHTAGLDRAERAELRADAGVELVNALPIDRTELVSAADPAKALAALRNDDDVVWAEPDGRVHLTSVMDDPGFGSLWALENTGQWIAGQTGTADDDIDAPAAWDQSQGAGVTVAVVDTGIAGHDDLAGQIAINAAEAGGAANVDDDGNGYRDDVQGWDFVGNGDNTPQDGNGHGTHVAGTIAAAGANRTGVVGVAPQAKILPLRVLNNAGEGSYSAIAAAFDYAGDNGVRVVNASLGGGYSHAIENAIAAHPNTLYVVAAGNDAADADSDNDAYPCALQEANVICVGATDNRDQIADFSNYGDTAVDLFAPGVQIYSTLKDWPYYGFKSGTSMASPHVAGAAALALSLRPGASTAFLRYALLASVDAKPQMAGKSVTGGRLNANLALNLIQGAEPPVEPPAPEPPVETPTPEPPVPAPPPVAPVATPDPVTVPALSLTHLKLSGAVRGKSGKLRVTFTLSRGSWMRYMVTPKGAKRAAGSWTTLGRTGANTLLLRRKLPTGKTLKRGSYTLTITAGTTVTASKVVKVR